MCVELFLLTDSVVVCGRPRTTALIRSQMTPLLSCVSAQLIHRTKDKGFEVQGIFDADALLKQLNWENDLKFFKQPWGDWFDHLQGEKKYLFLCWQISLGIWGLCLVFSTSCEVKVIEYISIEDVPWNFVPGSWQQPNTYFPVTEVSF